MRLYNDKPGKCQIGPARASFANVFKPRAEKKEDGSEVLKYSITLLIPKEAHKHLPDPNAEIDGIRKLVTEAAKTKWGDKPPAKLHNPVKDGDVETNGNGDPMYPGYWFIKASTNATFPSGDDKNLLVVNGLGEPIGSGFESGDWCRCKLQIATFDRPTKKGVTCYLEGVQWLYKDEPFAKPKDDNDFETVADAATEEVDYFAEA
jgi:hypothetical protein